MSKFLYYLILYYILTLGVLPENIFACCTILKELHEEASGQTVIHNFCEAQHFSWCSGLLMQPMALFLADRFGVCCVGRGVIWTSQQLDPFFTLPFSHCALVDVAFEIPGPQLRILL